MIAVVIIAILATVALPSYQNYMIKSKIREAQSNLVTLSLAAENAYQRSLSYPRNSLNSTEAIQLDENFKTWNPSSKTFQYQYTPLNNGLDFQIKATGHESSVLNCQLTLNNRGERNITNCAVQDTWINR